MPECGRERCGKIFTTCPATYLLHVLLRAKYLQVLLSMSIPIISGRGSGWLAAGCDVCPAAPNCRCDTRTFVSSLLNQHLKGKWGINGGQSALISGNKIVGTIRAVRVTAVSSVTSQLTWQLYTLHPQQLPAVNPCHWAAGC